MEKTVEMEIKEDLDLLEARVHKVYQDHLVLEEDKERLETVVQLDLPD
jgi:hypothetical protein